MHKMSAKCHRLGVLGKIKILISVFVYVLFIDPGTGVCSYLCGLYGNGKLTDGLTDCLSD